MSGSMSIVFDGLFSVVDVAMGVLGLWIARLVTRVPLAPSSTATGTSSL
jgi:predicted Co/Zn/Cd cation transporter (cation efflux family)